MWIDFKISLTILDIPEKVLEGASQISFSDFTQKNVEAAWVDGELDAFPIPAGQIAAIIKEIKSVREIIERIVAE